MIIQRYGGRYEGHYTCGRKGDATLADYESGYESTLADLRQTAYLLSAICFDDGKNQRYFNHFYTGGKGKF